MSILDVSVLVVNVWLSFTVGLHLARAPRSQGWAGQGARLAGILAAQAVMLPLIAWAISRGLALPRELAVGLLLVAACPVGDIANFYTLLARGDLRYSVLLNILSCLLSIGTMAAVYRLYGWLDGEPFPMAVPMLSMVLRLVGLIALPLAAGLAIRAWRPGLADRLSLPARGITLAGVVWLVGLVVIMQGTTLRIIAGPAALGSLLFVLLGLGAGALVSCLFARDGDRRVAIAFSFPVRNVALAAAIAVTMMGRVEYAAFAVVYFVVEVVVMLAVAGRVRKRQLENRVGFGVWSSS